VGPPDSAAGHAAAIAAAFYPFMQISSTISVVNLLRCNIPHHVAGKMLQYLLQHFGPS
jgi:hypothetical protein